MPDPRRRELLYDLVATGMRLYSDSAFRVVLIGGERLRMRPHLLVVSTHRSDADVPIICSRLYFGDRMYTRRGPRLHFAARDDLFERGVIAGLLPPALPPVLRRALFAVDPAPYLPSVRVNPIRSAITVQAIQALRFNPDATIEYAIPARLVRRIRERARAIGIAQPEHARDADRAEFADITWVEVSQDELPEAQALWRKRAQDAAGDLRRLIGVVERGGPLLLFPEGRPSPDGSIGPLQRGLGLLVRRGGPRSVLPLALAYDPFTRGRPRVLLATGVEFAPPRDSVEELVLAALRRTTPLTCAQLVSDRLLRAAEAGRQTVAVAALDEALATAVEGAVAEGRPTDPALSVVGSRRRRLSDCLTALARAGLVTTSDARTLGVDDRLRASPAVRRAALEYASARVPGPAIAAAARS